MFRTPLESRWLAGADSCLWESAIPKELAFPTKTPREYTPAWPLALWGSGGCVADSGGERKIAFLWLRGRGGGRREAGEMVETESAAPDFGAELL